MRGERIVGDERRHSCEERTGIRLRTGFEISPLCSVSTLFLVCCSGGHRQMALRGQPP